MTDKKRERENQTAEKAEKNSRIRELCIETVMRKTGWSRDESLEKINDARQRLGIKYGQYRACRMWAVPENEQEKVYRDFLEKRERKKKELRLEKEAAKARAGFRGSDVPDDGFDAAARALLDRFDGGKSLLTETFGDEDEWLVPYEGFSKVLGETIFPDTEKSHKEYDEFVYRFRSHKDIFFSREFFCVCFTDWLFFCKDMGYDPDDYFDYEFYTKGRKERESFLSAGYREDLKKAVNKDIWILADKGYFLRYFSRFVTRSWLDCNNCSKKDFKRFVRENPVFFAKENGRSGGQGIEKVFFSGISTGKLYKKYAERDVILEEAICQHPFMAEFNSDTVNTIRIWTLADADDTIRIMAAAARFGRQGGFADNYHHGGIGAIVDKETGRMITGAIDRSGNVYEKHPDSRKEFIGQVIPFWDRIISTVKEAAHFCMDKDRNIGWDVALTASGKVELVEGNSRPGFDIMQAQDMKGRKAEYEKYVPDLVEKMKK